MYQTEKYFIFMGQRLYSGSAVLFKGDGVIGCVINCCQKRNTVPNPLSLTHVGILVNTTPEELCNVIELSPHMFGVYKQFMLDQLHRDENILQGYVLEATGTA